MSLVTTLSTTTCGIKMMKMEENLPIGYCCIIPVCRQVFKQVDRPIGRVGYLIEGDWNIVRVDEHGVKTGLNVSGIIGIIDGD